MPLNNPAVAKWVYHELFPAAYDDVTDGWADWDISALVPVGTKAVEVRYTYTVGAGNQWGGVRKNGSALNRYFAVTLSGDNPWWAGTVEVDANRIIEAYSGVGAITIRYQIMGYWIEE